MDSRLLILPEAGRRTQGSGVQISDLGGVELGLLKDGHPAQI